MYIIKRYTSPYGFCPEPNSTVNDIPILSNLYTVLQDCHVSSGKEILNADGYNRCLDET